LPQATKAAANNVAKRSDFFMGKFPLSDAKTFSRVVTIFDTSQTLQLSRWTQAPSTQLAIIGDFP
jgi:hypothetical protein